MARFRLHPFTALFCTAVTAALFLLTGMRGATSGLTPEQAELLGYFGLVKLSDGQGNHVPTVRVSGVNFQLVNGLGLTESENGAGNLIVGYHEPGAIEVRTGSHNLAVGMEHSYTRHGGVMFGSGHRVEAPFACATGGSFSYIDGAYGAISGGFNNIASGENSVVCGGSGNFSSGLQAVVLGGGFNEAFGHQSTIAGGAGNSANGVDSTVTGGCSVTVGGACMIAP